MKFAWNILILGILLLVAPTSAQAQILLGYWDFNNDNPAFNSGTSAIGSFNTTAASYGEQYSSQILSSNTLGLYSSSESLDLSNLTTGLTGSNAPMINGLVGSTRQMTTTTQSSGFGVYQDTTINQASSDSTTGGSLILMNESGSGSLNGHYITLTLDSANYNNLALSYATRATSGATASEAWSYSLDGTNYFSLSTLNLSTTGTFFNESLNLSSLSSNALNNQGTFYLRVTVNYNVGDSLSFDNIQLTGVSAVPEPSTYALMGFGVLLLSLALRCKRA
jgi:hypothetical protein